PASEPVAPAAGRRPAFRARAAGSPAAIQAREREFAARCTADKTLRSRLRARRIGSRYDPLVFKLTGRRDSGKVRRTVALTRNTRSLVTVGMALSPTRSTPAVRWCLCHASVRAP